MSLGFVSSQRDPEEGSISEAMTEISPALLQLVYFHSYSNQQVIETFFSAANNLAPDQTNAGDYRRILFGLGVASFLVAAGLSAFSDKQGFVLLFTE